MIANALRSLNKNGRAAIIMGGHNRYDEKGRLTGDRVFFNYLYNHYNVSNVINIDGSLYAKQGTSFPIRMILIDGVKAEKSGFAPLEDKQTSSPITTFEELYQRVQKLKEYENDNRKSGILQPEVDADTRPGNVVYGSAAGVENKDEAAGVGTGSSQDKLLGDTKQTNEGKAPSDDSVSTP
ncbi:MAG: hypothetical protein FJY20_10205 [Bacteroidetes bacterium]|nr:hypothetical protein [Bacteroidota bacterium]